MQIRPHEDNKVAAQTAIAVTLQKVERVYKSDYVLVIKGTTIVIPENCPPPLGIETVIIPASTFWQQKREAYQRSGGISFVGNPPINTGSHPSESFASSTRKSIQLKPMIPQNMQQNPLNRFGVFGARSFHYATKSPIPSVSSSTISGEMPTANMSINMSREKKRAFVKEKIQRKKLELTKSKKTKTMLTPGDESTENSPTLLVFSPEKTPIGDMQLPVTFSDTLTNDDLANLLLETDPSSTPPKSCENPDFFSNDAESYLELLINSESTLEEPLPSFRKT